MDEQEKWTERQLGFLKVAMATAEKNGWNNAEGYRPITVAGYIFLIKRDVPPQYLFSTRELLFDHEFSKALWGTAEVDSNGWELKTIRLWANQVAVEHAGKLLSVDNSNPVVHILDMPDFDLTKPPMELVDVKRTEYELKRMTGEISFRTHQLQPLKVYAETQPAYIWHMQKMATFENPEDYLSPLSLGHQDKGTDMKLKDSGTNIKGTSKSPTPAQKGRIQ